VGNELHYIARPNGDTCAAVSANCVDYGPMLQRRYADFGRMRAFHNALVRKPFTAGAQNSHFELTRYRWDKMDITGPTWITTGWDVDVVPNDNEGGGFGWRVLPDEAVYPAAGGIAGGNTGHHVTGVANVVTGVDVPIDTGTFAPLPSSPLRGAAAAWPAELPAAMQPQFSATVDPANPGRVMLVPRVQWTTIGAVE
jgi:hypothetical protein